MNFEQYYIKTQKSKLNWSVGVTALLLILSLYSIIIKGVVSNPASTWIGLSCYLLVFIGQLMSRITLSEKIARSTFVLYFLFTVYYFIEMSFKYKSMLSTFEETTARSPRFLVIFSYCVAVVFLGALNLLFYNSYRAAQRIQAIRNEQTHSLSSKETV